MQCDILAASELTASQLVVPCQRIKIHSLAARDQQGHCFAPQLRALLCLRHSQLHNDLGTPHGYRARVSILAMCPDGRQSIQREIPSPQDI